MRAHTMNTSDGVVSLPWLKPNSVSLNNQTPFNYAYPGMGSNELPSPWVDPSITAQLKGSKPGHLKQNASGIEGSPQDSSIRSLTLEFARRTKVSPQDQSIRSRHNRFWWLLMHSNGFQWILVDSDGFQWIPLHFNEFWRILIDPDGFWCILMDSSERFW